MDFMTSPLAAGYKICDHKGPTHEVPHIPIMIDGTKAESSNVRDFFGKPLHTVLDTDAVNKKMPIRFVVVIRHTSDALAKCQR